MQTNSVWFGNETSSDHFPEKSPSIIRLIWCCRGVLSFCFFTPEYWKKDCFPHKIQTTCFTGSFFANFLHVGVISDVRRLWNLFSFRNLWRGSPGIPEFTSPGKSYHNSALNPSFVIDKMLYQEFGKKALGPWTHLSESDHCQGYPVHWKWSKQNACDGFT